MHMLFHVRTYPPTYNHIYLDSIKKGMVHVHTYVLKDRSPHLGCLWIESRVHVTFLLACPSLSNLQVLSKRVSGLSKGLELAAVQCSQQREMVQRMSRELSETREFVEVRTGEDTRRCVTTHSDGVHMSLRQGVESMPS